MMEMTWFQITETMRHASTIRKLLAGEKMTFEDDIRQQKGEEYDY